VLYHTLTFTYLNVVYSLYVASFLSFILYAKREQLRYLLVSLCCYVVAILWYELGFFLPLLLMGYLMLYQRKKIRLVLPFLLFSVVYLLWRWDVLGIAPADTHIATIRFERIVPNIFEMVPNLYLGRQMAKAVLYGAYQFPAMESPWLFLALAGDLICLWAGIRWVKRLPFEPIPRRALILAAGIFILFLVPACLTWGVLERHTGLASIGFVLLFSTLIFRFQAHRVKILGALLAVGLVISQGTAWSQVVACRINRAIFDSLVESKEEVLLAERVLIDQDSFGRNIPYTWVSDPHNQLDTYWGADALLGRGFPFLVHLAVGEPRPVQVIRSQIEKRESEWVFQIYNRDAYQLEEQSVPHDGSFLLDYDAVYQNGFRNGNRAKPCSVTP